ncbi:hypothetical protein DIE14_02620 [Burkholderia sp. Bp9017]|uniref:hypothetical protein n=1 Tax=Burkholderia TaxID=32008 RepID=UPI000F5EF2A8|nr:MULTISPECIES: hypothetical protein [Burkholderia]MBY4871040.1 hypothetical protein [Burkholderia anthina]RQZ30696.1 hypothetical protein DIE14_02620 [Burkholderia sp. Bp9017]RQZ36589.1 hypothetical protein DIE13_04500 [Burkholderia sp. Bp9016]
MTPRNFRTRDGQRRTPEHAAPAVQAGIRPPADLDALLALARESGLLVTLDGQIGREKYQSVAGSVFALQRFATALCARAAADAPVVPGTRRKTRPGWPRLRNRAPGTRGRLHGAHRRARVCRGAGRRHALHALRIT